MMENEVMKFPLNTNVIDNKEDLVKVRLKVKDKDEFVVWLKNYEDLNKVTFRVLRGYTLKGLYVIYKADYRCQHNTYPRSETSSEKHTNCPVTMNVTVKRITKHSRSKDPHMPEYPTAVVIKGSHNHRIKAASALKFRDPSESTRQKFLHYFSLGCSPSNALELHKNDIMEEYGNYVLIEADRALLPDIKWVYRLYNTLNKQYGELSTSEVLQVSSREQTNKFNEQGIKCSIKKYQDDIKGRYKPELEKPQGPIVRHEGEALYEGSSLDKTYNVNSALGICDCYVGKTGTPCKHQHVVAVKADEERTNIVPEDSESKILHWVTVGEQDISEDWFGSMDFKSPEKRSLAMTGNTTEEATGESDDETQCNMDLSEDSCTPSINEKEELEADYLAFFREGYEADPTGFLAPMAAFLKSARLMKTKSGLYSALNSFGKANINKS